MATKMGNSDPTRHTMTRRTRVRATTPLFVAALALCATALLGADKPMKIDITPSPKEAKAQILSPKNGAMVSSPVVVKFELTGMEIAPAGTATANSGHHHLIIDSPLPNLEGPIPKDAKHRHYGGGETEVSLELEPGVHTLQLLLGDYRHIPHDPPVSSEIVSIMVK